MRRFGIGVAIGSITFLVGIVPFCYPFEGFFRVTGGLSDCVIRVEPSAEYGMPSGGGLSDYGDDSRAVYAAVVEHQMDGRAYLVVGDTTPPDDWFVGLDRNRQLAAVEKETFEGYRNSNSISRYLPHGLIDDSRVRFVDFDDSEKIFKLRKIGWTEFRRRFPDANGLITFSSVGFNLAHTQALVGVERQYSGLSSDGMFFVLKKVNGRWMIAREIIAWSQISRFRGR